MQRRNQHIVLRKLEAGQATEALTTAPSFCSNNDLSQAIQRQDLAGSIWNYTCWWYDVCFINTCSLCFVKQPVTGKASGATRGRLTKCCDFKSLVLRPMSAATDCIRASSNSPSVAYAQRVFACTMGIRFAGWSSSVNNATD